MARTEPFDKYLNDYENWFKEYKYVYESELKAVKHFIPENKNGIEIGIGTGRFALPFGIKVGVEPSSVMRRFAVNLGLKVHKGTAEKLPIPDKSYDFALMVTTICFVDDVKKSFSEVKRILIPGGNFIVGFVDRNSLLGKLYEKMKEQNKFYRYATFYSAVEVKKLLEENEFINIEIVQTVFGELSAIHKLQNFKVGYCEGGFVVVSALKKHN
jgi:SAM-dependent methyltransferase